MVAAPSERTRIIVHPGAPPDADVVFAATGEDGGIGPLLAAVLRWNHWPEGVLVRLPADGFSHHRLEEDRSIVIVAPRAQNGTGLRLAVRDALISMEKVLHDRTIWIPLIGTRPGGLIDTESAEMIGIGISAFLRKSDARPSEIVIAPSGTIDPKTAVVIGDMLLESFGTLADVTVADEFGDFGYDGSLPDTDQLASAAQGKVREQQPVALEEDSLGSDFAQGTKIDRAESALFEALRLAAEEKEKPSAATATPEPDPIHTTAPFQSDQAAKIDKLNRMAVAKTLGTLVDDVWKTEPDADDSSFMIHLHGRWGSGKTSILNFLKDELAGGGIAAQEPPREPPWLVVDYNAWRNQGLGPAWWTVMNAVHDGAISGLRKSPDDAWWRVRVSHLFWRLKIAWIPTAITAVVTLVALYVVLFVELRDGWPDILKNVTALATFLGTIFLLRGESGIVNSQTAKRYVELARDPLGPLTRRYEDMIEEIGRPVAVMIDDLDRCNAQFVVELLQTVQTLYRRARVLYVVAGDRDWICASYEKIYSDFTGTVAEPGRSLGHLFVEKVFQLSVEVPPLLDHQRDSFWNDLIAGTPETTPAEEQRIEEEIAEEVDNLDTEAEIISYVQSQRGDARRASIAGAQAFRRMQSAPLTREREHFLSRYAHLIEPNPRAMKRLLNAYGFRRGYDIQAVAPSDPDALARWTILENRWPILTDHLSGRKSGADTGQAIDALMLDDEVRRVAEGLTWAALRPVPGAPDAGSGNR